MTRGVELTDALLLEVTDELRERLGTHRYPLHRLEAQLKHRGVHIGRQNLQKKIWGLETTGLLYLAQSSRGYEVVRYTQAQVDAWSEAERLANILGGKASKHTSERNPAEIVLSLDQAREFIQKWRASLDAT